MAGAGGLRICLILGLAGWAASFQAMPGNAALRPGMGMAKAHRPSGVLGLKAATTAEPVLQRIGTASMKKVESLKNFDVGARKRYFLWTLAERVYDELLLFLEWAVLSFFKLTWMVRMSFSKQAPEIEEANSPKKALPPSDDEDDKILDSSLLASASAVTGEAKSLTSSGSTEIDRPMVNWTSFSSFLLVAVPIVSYYVASVTDDKYIDLAPGALTTLSLLIVLVDLTAGRSAGLTTWIRRQTPVSIRRTLSAPRVPDELTHYQKEIYEKEVNARKLVDFIS